MQVTGEMNNVKNAIAIISSRLRESQHRDRSHFHGRLHSPERFFPPNDDFIPPMNNLGRRASVDGSNFGSRLSGGFNSSRGNSNSSRTSGYSIESGGGPFTDNAQLIAGELLVFRILCAVDKVDTIIGESDGIIDLLQNDIGVEVEIIDLVAGSDEQIIIVSSDEVPIHCFCHYQSKLMSFGSFSVKDLYYDISSLCTKHKRLHVDYYL